MLTHKDILLKLGKIERKVARHDDDSAMIFKCLKKLLEPVQPERRAIGFRRKNEGD